MEIPDDHIMEPMFYMDDTRGAAHVPCPKCNKANHTVVAFGLCIKRMVVYYGCRRCHFRWKLQ
eukprot:gene28861-32049_t